MNAKLWKDHVVRMQSVKTLSQDTIVYVLKDMKLSQIQALLASK